jgi:hypothetical protein
VPYLCGFGFAKVEHSSFGRGSFSFIFVLRSFSPDFPPDARRELAQPGWPTKVCGFGVSVPTLAVPPIERWGSPCQLRRLARTKNPDTNLGAHTSFLRVGL